MANGIKIGNLDISAFKVGDSDCKVYLGDTLLYEPTPPGFQGKWLATYTGGTTSSAECGASSAITQNEINLTNLVSVEIGDYCVTSIGDEAFYGCSSLTSCTIGYSVTSIGVSAFDTCSGLTTCTIGSGVTSIGDYAFQFCSGLTSIDIPDSVTSIGEGAFYGCTSLTSIDIPDCVTSIAAYAFGECSSLTSIDIPSGVTSIGDFAFAWCSSLTSITIEATTPPTLGTAALEDTNNCPIYVPSASVNAYKTAWSTYASRIQAIPTPTTLQWVTFNNGDDMHNLEIYGIKGTVSEIAKTFNEYGANTITVNGMDCGFLPFGSYCLEIGGGCYAEEVSGSDNIELIFSNIGCSDYYISPVNTASGTIQLYIYA